MAVLLSASVGFAQQQQPQTQTPQATFRTTTRLIVQSVFVKDKDGKPIEGLTAKDFVITEDGQPQDIAFVEYQRLATDAPALAADPQAPVPLTARPATTAPTVAPTTTTQISSPPSGDIKYQDKRLLVMYFDSSSMGPADQIRAYTNALKFIDTQMTASDLIAIMSFQQGAVSVKNDFTADKEKLREVIGILIYGDDQNNDGIPDHPEGTAFGQNDAEFNIFNTDRQLAALQTAVNMLKGLPEQKTLLYFASGLRLNGTDNQAQLRATVNAAIRANVTLNPIDARGLVAMPPMGDATQRRSGDGADEQLPAIAGHAVLARQGHRRQGDVRLQRSVAGHRAGLAGGDELLHHRLLQHAPGDRRQVPPRARLAERTALGVGQSHVPPGVLRRQVVRQLHRRRQGASARGRADARQPGHGDHDRAGSELLPAQHR
jgi:VWFA-related protein